MIAVSIAVSQVDSSRTFVKIFGPFRNSYLHHRASPVLSYGISDLAIRLKWMLSAYAPAGRNWPLAMLVLFADIRRYPGSQEGRGSGQYGDRRTFSLWEAGTGLPAANPHAVDLPLRRPRSSDEKFLAPFLNNYTLMKVSPRTC